MNDPLTTSAAYAFGPVLRQLRTQAGLSLRELAKITYYDHTRIARAEQGEWLAPLDRVQDLDDALGAGGLLVALRRGDGPATPAMTASGSYESEPVILDMPTQDGKLVQVTISRRAFAQLLASGALSAVLPYLADPDQAQRVSRAITQPTRVDDQVIDYFQRVLTEHYTADKMLGPRHLLRPVLAQIEVLDELRRGADTSYADPLLQTLAAYGEMAGWLHQDLGETGEAMDWTRRAAEWAACAGDTQMAAYLLVRQSNIAVATEDYAAVVQLAAAARRHSAELDPKLAALAAQQQARGLAMLGRHRQAFDLLDQAADLLRDHPHVTHPNTPVYLHHYDLDTLQEQSAACHRAAGHADTAITILEKRIAELPANLARDRGHLTAKLAVAVTQSPQPDPARAAHLGHEALTVAQQTGSARIHRELRTLNTGLRKRWPDDSHARAFHEAFVGV
ncbi:helix-turn-helix domain-containing protein [Nonomuraea glycinis]|uniref:helix-turn-helix domain-containing protein n=1 Tax=Nonomuraea glycinis TaxID=2047744 RepID=UPI002E14DCB6|nr:helix-turn-helix domain-containing protein [Nonomuraea glycinis]